MALTTGAFLSDSGNPSNGNGSDGDHYRDTANQNLWFKAAGSWTLVGNLNDNTPDGIGTIWSNGSGVPLTGNGAYLSEGVGVRNIAATTTAKKGFYLDEFAFKLNLPSARTGFAFT